MGDTIRFKKGLKSEAPVLDIGMPGFNTDDNSLFIGGANGNVEFSNKEYLDSKLFTRSGYNIAINGEFRINQRDQETYTENGKYTIDRWSLANFGRDSKSHGSLTHKNESGFNYISLTGAKDQQLYIQQKLEPGYCRMLSNKTVTLSAYIRVQNMTKGNLFVQVSHQGSTSKHPNKFVDYTKLTNEWQRISVTTKLGDLLTDIVLQIGTFDNESEGYKIANEEAIIDISYVKFEVGDEPTEFIPRLYSEELALCQRYYEKSNHNIRGIVGGDSLRIDLDVQYKVTKRSAPTVTLYGSSNEKNTIKVVSSEINLNAIIYANGMDGFGCIDVHAKDDSFTVIPNLVCELFAWESDSELY